ncbi:MAG: helix-turn-helix domain-containing protein [Candidatus Methanoperedens sp.]|nr:helix-turn-helix domain-containing protein [Candidatus Methanoperedens sp.]
MLETSGLLTQKDIVRRTYLPARTVRYALNRLREENVLEERFYFPDARQSLYGLSGNVREVING